MLFISCLPRQLGFIAALCSENTNLCLLMDSAYGFFSLCTPEQNKKCLEKMLGISQRGKLTLGSSCIFLFMVTSQYLWGWGKLQSILLVKLPWRKKKNLHNMFKISPVQWGVLENFRKHQYLYPIKGSEGQRQALLQTVLRSCKNKGEKAKFG